MIGDLEVQTNVATGDSDKEDFQRFDPMAKEGPGWVEPDRKKMFDDAEAKLNDKAAELHLKLDNGESIIYEFVKKDGKIALGHLDATGKMIFHIVGIEPFKVPRLGKDAHDAFDVDSFQKVLSDPKW